MARMQAWPDDTEVITGVPRAQRRAMAKPIACYADRYRSRDMAMVNAYASGEYSLKAIAGHFGEIIRC